MGWLLDTNIISQLAPRADGSPKAPPHLSAWLKSPFRLSIPICALGRRNYRRYPEASPCWARRDVQRRLDAWLGALIALYGERILPIDAKVGAGSGNFGGEARRRWPPPWPCRHADRRNGASARPRASDRQSETLCAAEPGDPAAQSSRGLITTRTSVAACPPPAPKWALRSWSMSLGGSQDSRCIRR